MASSMPVICSVLQRNYRRLFWEIMLGKLAASKIIHSLPLILWWHTLPSRPIFHHNFCSGNCTVDFKLLLVHKAISHCSQWFTLFNCWFYCLV
ncbi:hypothetical protein LguiA_025688 [Lonicera macranthoides]